MRLLRAGLHHGHRRAARGEPVAERRAGGGASEPLPLRRLSAHPQGDRASRAGPPRRRRAVKFLNKRLRNSSAAAHLKRCTTRVIFLKGHCHAEVPYHPVARRGRRVARARAGPWPPPRRRRQQQQPVAEPQPRRSRRSRVSRGDRGQSQQQAQRASRRRSGRNSRRAMRSRSIANGGHASRADVGRCPRLPDAPPGDRLAAGGQQQQPTRSRSTTATARVASTARPAPPSESSSSRSARTAARATALEPQHGDYGQARSIIRADHNRRWANGGWNRNWRNDHRYDWRRYRNSHRSIFHLGFYYDPFGYSYRR